MFEGWGFLIAEIWSLIAIALLVGFIAGWIVFRQSKASAASPDGNDTEQLRATIASLKVELERATAAGAPAPQPAVAVTPSKPRTLKQARKSGPDDLKVIKGIGPELEKLCNDLGFYHYDQIANWTDAEIAWVDENLEGFKGRVTRDRWVEQAKALAA